MNEFFNDPKFQDEVRQAADAARTHMQSIVPPTVVREGDSFLFSESLDLPVRWVATQRHKDNANLWYLLAADEFPMIGTSDVELHEPRSASPLIMRCSVGFWAHVDDIPLDRFVGRIDPDVIADCRDLLAAMLRGKVIETEQGILTNVSEGYREWIANLSEITDRIESRIQSEPVVLKLGPSDTSWLTDTRIRQFQEKVTQSLAADAAGVSAESTTPDGHILQSELSGVLVLQADGHSFDLVYFPSDENDVPPGMGDLSNVRLAAGRWVKGSDDVFTWSNGLKPKDGRLRFAVGMSKFDIELSSHE